MNKTYHMFSSYYFVLYSYMLKCVKIYLKGNRCETCPNKTDFKFSLLISYIAH